MMDFDYKVVPVYDRGPISGMKMGIKSWIVKDLQEFKVCECSTKHNAELICKLLNKYS